MDKQANKITVVYIITKLELGGAQKICLSLFNNKNINSYLISGKSGVLVSELDNNKNLILFDNLKREVSIFNIFNEFKFLFKLTKKLRELKKIDKNLIVHTHSTKAGLVGRWAAFFANIKHRIHTIHGYGFHNNQNRIIWFIIYFLELITSFITTKFICVSKADLVTGNKLFFNFNKKSKIIRAAIDWNNLYINNFLPNNFPQKQDKNQIFTFGTIACFKPQKNLFDLLKAFKLVHQNNRNTRLEILGDGVQRNLIENWIEQNNLKNNIILHGWQKDISLFLKKWHVFTLSSLWEGLPCSIIEARVFKLPVICYDTGGINEVIFNNQNGFLIKQKDWENLSNYMAEISNNKDLFYKLQHYQDNLEEFKNINMLKLHEDLYQELVFKQKKANLNYYTKN